MTEPIITWARLFDGRLWHIQRTPEDTWCGKTLDSHDERRAERIDTAPPGNGWVCDRCVRAVHDVAAIAIQVWRGDPRRRAEDQIPTSTNQEETER